MMQILLFTIIGLVFLLIGFYMGYLYAKNEREHLDMRTKLDAEMYREVVSRGWLDQKVTPANNGFFQNIKYPSDYNIQEKSSSKDPLDNNFLNKGNAGSRIMKYPKPQTIRDRREKEALAQSQQIYKEEMKMDKSGFFQMPTGGVYED